MAAAAVSQDGYAGHCNQPSICRHIATGSLCSSSKVVVRAGDSLPNPTAMHSAEGATTLVLPKGSPPCDNHCTRTHTPKRTLNGEVGADGKGIKVLHCPSMYETCGTPCDVQFTYAYKSCRIELGRYE